MKECNAQIDNTKNVSPMECVLVQIYFKYFHRMGGERKIIRYKYIVFRNW